MVTIIVFRKSKYKNDFHCYIIKPCTTNTIHDPEMCFVSINIWKFYIDAHLKTPHPTPKFTHVLNIIS